MCATLPAENKEKSMRTDQGTVANRDGALVRGEMSSSMRDLLKVTIVATPLREVPQLKHQESSGFHQQTALAGLH